MLVNSFDAGIRHLACALGLLWAASTAAYGPYEVDVIRVLDGDTVEVNVDLWPGLRQRVKVRLDGINAPEIHTRRRCEKEAGLHARDRLAELLKAAGRIELDDVELGKYAGRVLGRILADGEDVAERLLAEGLVRPYSGGRRKPWPCTETR